MKRNGFTLLEVLVALAVLGLILAALDGGLRFTLRAAERQARLVGSAGDFDAADRALRRLVAEADPGGPGIVPLRGTPAGVAFTSTLPAGAGGGPAEIRLGVEGGALTLRWLPHRFGRAFGPPPEARGVTLLPEVRRLELAYWTGSEWRRDWAEPELPALLRLRVVFQDETVRHWPDLVLATQRRPMP